MDKRLRPYIVPANQEQVSDTVTQFWLKTNKQTNDQTMTLIKKET